MSKKFVFTVVFSVLVLSGSVRIVYAGGCCPTDVKAEEKCDMPEEEEMKASMHGMHGVFIGEYVKVGGGKYGIKLKDGAVYNFVKNDHSEDLINGKKFKGNKIVKIVVWGKKLDNDFIDVERYKLCIKGKGKKIECEEYVWCVGLQKISKLQKAGGKFSYKGKEHWYCCPSCKTVFDENPEKYLTKKGAKLQEEKILYVCPMGCATSSKPGKCPKCGMKMNKLEK